MRAERGRIMAVFRPLDPVAAKYKAADILSRQNAGAISQDQAKAEYSAMLHDQPYSFTGWAGPDGKYALSAAGAFLSRVREGDAYVALDPLLPLPPDGWFRFGRGGVQIFETES
jgi:hypothetical protein